ncbi:MAG: hypothetical protein JW715_12555 [Sedimentisphaerales bacterium]|nr:hypothetical protein [Sedimentisphaerales bacterium]
MASERKRKNYWLIITLIAFVSIFAAFTIHTLGISYYYQEKFVNIYHTEFFPNNEPYGYHKLICTIQKNNYLRKQILEGIHNLSGNRYQDRWGNYPILHAMIEHLTRFPDDIPVLVSLMKDSTLPERTRFKAKSQLAKIISDSAESQLKNYNGIPIRLSEDYADILLEIAQSEDYDLMDIRCCAMRALGATGVEDAIPVLIKNTESSPKRLRLSAYKGLINMSRIDNFGTYPEIKEILLSLLRTGDHQLRIELLDSLPERSNKPGMIVETDDIMPLLDDSDNDVVYRAIHILQVRDEHRAIDKIITLTDSPSPYIRGFCRFFLEQTEHLSPEQLWPLVHHDSNEVRVLALAVAFRQNAYGTKSGQFRNILLELEKDPDKDIGLVASMYLERFLGKSRQAEYQNAGLVKQNLFTRAFNPPRPKHIRPQLTAEELKALQKKLLEDRISIINKAVEYFSKETKAGTNADIYQLLIEKFTQRSEPLVIMVPKLADTGGLYTQNQNQVILSQEQARTLREDFNYSGPGLYLSEIFINSDRSEAWIEVTTYQAPLAAQGWGIILKKEYGKWNITSQKIMWIS